MKKPPTHSPTRVSGFSLIEILAALVLIALMASMAVPSMNGYVDRSMTRRALDQLVSDIAFARLNAVQQGRRTTVGLQSGGTYVVRSLGTDDTWTTLKTVNLTNEYPGVAFGGDVTTLEFSSRGLLMTAIVGDGFIKISRAATRDSVFISPAGRVYRAF